MADVDIVKTTTVRPWFSLSAATYMLKNAVENDTRYVLVAEQGEELRAVVTVGRQTFKAPNSST